MNFLPSLTGSLSQPAADNPTVYMMEMAYRHHGLDFRYVNMDTPPELLADAVRGLKAQGYVGFNCSLPHKVAVIAHLDELGESSKIIGAVNCAVKRGDQWIGENTDGKGFLLSLEALTSPKGKHIVVLGAGGAARAICVELALAGASRLTVVNRSAERGLELCTMLRSATSAAVEFVPWVGDYAIPASADVVVNATSMGLAPNVAERVPVEQNALRSGLVVADVIPNPPLTAFLKEAQARGCQTLDGLGMLINQGAANFEYWTGLTPDKEIMRAALEEVFGVTKP